MKLARLVLTLVILVDVAECVSMVRRGSRGESDLGVFHRAAAAVRQGAGEELYRQPDGRSGWPNCIPPAGLLFFYVAADAGNTFWSFIWLSENLVFLALAVWSLSELISGASGRRPRLGLVPPVVACALPVAAPADSPCPRLAARGGRGCMWTAIRGLRPSTGNPSTLAGRGASGPREARALVWSLVVLLALAAGSLQVGQLSVLFVACWSVAALALQRGKRTLAHLALAIPAAIKLYPALLLAAPLTLARGRRDAMRHLRCFATAFLLVAVAIPAVVWGPGRASRLETSFVENVVFSRHGRISRMIDLHSSANQGLAPVLLRYLTTNPTFHRVHRGVPHLSWPRKCVLVLASGLVGIVLFVTLWLARRWLVVLPPDDPWAVVYATGTWVAALYLALPETRARYAVYASLAFVPILHHLSSRWPELNRLSRVVAVWTAVLTAVLVLSLVPHEMRVYGVGLLGGAALWIAALVATRAHARDTVGRRLDRRMCWGRAGGTGKATGFAGRGTQASRPRSVSASTVARQLNAVVARRTQAGRLGPALVCWPTAVFSAGGSR